MKEIHLFIINEVVFARILPILDLINTEENYAHPFQVNNNYPLGRRNLMNGPSCLY